MRCAIRDCDNRARDPEDSISYCSEACWCIDNGPCGDCDRCRETKVEVIRTKKEFGRDARSGIHLLNPTEQELERATEDALAKGFESVYVHTSEAHSLQSIKVQV